jgi:hypothetical protein
MGDGCMAAAANSCEKQCWRDMQRATSKSSSQLRICLARLSYHQWEITSLEQNENAIGAHAKRKATQREARENGGEMRVCNK